MPATFYNKVGVSPTNGQEVRMFAITPALWGGCSIRIQVNGRNYCDYAASDIAQADRDYNDLLR